MTLIRREGSDKPIEGPPCPYAFPGSNDKHLFFNQLKDRLYRLLEKDEDDNPVENEAEKLYNKLDEIYPYNMYLYKSDAHAIERFTKYVESYWWQCSICYFVLPVTSVELRPR